MSGIVSGIDYSVLFSGSASFNGGASGNLLSILYGNGRGSGGVSLSDPIAALAQAESHQTAEVAQEAASPAVARDIAAFKAAIAKAPNITSALQNPAVLQVLLTANNLVNQIPYPALAQKALMSDLSDPKSLANQLTDTRWKTAAATYNFASAGLAALQNPATQATLANAYAEVTWLNSLDQTTPGLSSALTFKQHAASITSIDQILGDPIYRDVVTTAFAIPLQIAFQDLPAQEKAISSQLDLTQLKNANFVNGLTDRYLLAKQQAASTGATTGLNSFAGGLTV